MPFSSKSDNTQRNIHTIITRAVTQIYKARIGFIPPSPKQDIFRCKNSQKRKKKKVTTTLRGNQSTVTCTEHILAQKGEISLRGYNTVSLSSWLGDRPLKNATKISSATSATLLDCIHHCVCPVQHTHTQKKAPTLYQIYYWEKQHDPGLLQPSSNKE